MTNEMKNALRVLADPTRLHIVQFLAQSCCAKAEVNPEGGVLSPSAGEVCCHITGATKITSTVSHHLHELESAGLVSLERKGKMTLCSLRPETLTELAEAIQGLASGKNHECC